MDEKTERVVVRMPENLIVGLKAIAEARGWSVSRTMREAVREMVQRAYDRDLETHLRERNKDIALAGMPPEAP